MIDAKEMERRNAQLAEQIGTRLLVGGVTLEQRLRDLGYIE